jgi:hypothetical protein
MILLIYLATWTKYAVNIAIALQVVLGAVSVTLDTIVHRREVRSASPLRIRFTNSSPTRLVYLTLYSAAAQPSSHPFLRL